jgi:molybdenum cofactor guanylyltransferase
VNNFFKKRNLVGVVLCGGGSTRMGSDKGLLKVEEETWAELAARKLIALQLPVVVSVNARQAPVYENIFDREQLILDNDVYDFKAPLAGLLSVHLSLPTEDLFVLACDIKDMTTTLMQPLLDWYKKEEAEAYVYTTPGMHQPLCGIYTANGLKRINDMLREGSLRKYSMMRVLQVLNTHYVPAKGEDYPAFNNYNNPEEL